MRWPFGPPHLTLKPSKKQKNKKTETKTTTSNHKTKQNKQPKTRPTPKRKTKTKKHKNNQTLVVLTLLQLYQTKNRMTLKPEKKNKQKDTLLPCSKTTHYLSSIFCFLFTYSVYIATAVFLWKHYKNCVFLKNSFSKTQLVNPLFHPSQKHLFPQKGVIFGFGQLPLKPLFV